MITVLFACVHNAGRSRMAEAFFRDLADPDKARSLSAGTDPAPEVHPEVRAAMQEIGIDTGDEPPRRLTAELAAEVDWLVTMGCGEACPVVPGVHLADWPFRDPKGGTPAEVRRIRDEVCARVGEFIRQHGWQRPDTLS